MIRIGEMSRFLPANLSPLFVELQLNQAPFSEVGHRNHVALVAIDRVELNESERKSIKRINTL